MKDSSPDIISVAPPRLSEESGVVGDAIRAKLNEPAASSSAGSFSKLRALHRKRVRRQRTSWALAAAGVVLAPVLAQQLGSEGQLIEKETAFAVGDIEPPSSTPSPTTEDEPQTPGDPSTDPVDEGQQGEEPLRPSQRDAVDDTSNTVEYRPPPEVPRDGSRQQVDEPATPNEDALSCSRWVRQGEYQKALSCYEQGARGGGVGAELAFLEKARLQRRAFNQPAAALKTLDDYSSRFSDGALRREAVLMRLDVLLDLGQDAKALSSVNSLLDDRGISERRDEFLLLRARLLARQGNCQRARADASEAEKHGASKTKAEEATAACKTRSP